MSEPVAHQVVPPLGRIAYDAYTDAAAGRSLATGAALPSWEQLPDPIRTAWQAAAAAVSIEVRLRSGGSN